MNNYDQVLKLTSHMTLAEKVRLIEHLSTELRHDLETEAYKTMPWEQFIDLTYGSLADDPIERNQPIEADKRNMIA
jgi:hypothetical protein